MARYIGKVQGGRGEASRIGHSTTGINASVAGWHQGCSVRMYAKGDKDVVVAKFDGGSGGTAYYGEAVLEEGEIHLSCGFGGSLAATDANVAALLTSPALRKRLKAQLWIEGDAP
jgi:hypothetical protein